MALLTISCAVGAISGVGVECLMLWPARNQALQQMPASRPNEPQEEITTTVSRTARAAAAGLS